MWKLTIEDDQTNKTVVHLIRDEYTIGRAEENAIRLTERNVSRRHARVAKDAEGVWSLHDVESYNGLYVNGLRVAQHQPLNHCDLVQLGDYRMIVENEAVETRSDKVQTVPGLPRLSMSTQSDRLMELVGPDPGVEFALTNQRMVIGRGEECDLSINHPSVSRVHAEIIPFGDGRYEVRDLQSANGVRVNGVELPQSLLDARDVIELGDVILKFIPSGELFIPGADDTQARAALAQARAKPGLPTAAKVAIGGGLLALGLALVLAMRGGEKTELAVEGAPAERGAKILAEAKSLLGKGDADGALSKANQIPADSNLRDSAEFKNIYAAWADAMFDRAAKTEELGARRALLEQVSRSTGVDSVRRKRAAGELAGLDDQGAVDVANLPNARPEPAAAGIMPRVAAPEETRRGSAAPGAADTAATKPPQNAGLVRKNPFDDGDAPPAPAGNQSVQDLATSGERAKLLQAKNALQAKVQSGQATDRDLKMLRGLCKQLGDASCSN